MTFTLAGLRIWCDLRPLRQRLGLALAMFAAALALRITLFSLDAGYPYVTFYPAAALALLLLGTGPGIVVALLSAITAYYAFSGPIMSWQPDRDSVISTGLFLVLSALLGTLSAESRRARRSLQMRELQYRSFLNDQLDLFCRYKPDGTIIYVNDAFCRDFGVVREAVIGHAWKPIAWHEDIDHITEQLARLGPDCPVVTIENRVVTANKGVVWRQFTNRAFFDEHGNIRELQSVGRDIQERKLLADQLASTSAQLQDLYDRAPCGYHSLDEQGRYVSVNDTELGWLRCSRAEIVGKQGPSDFYTEESRARFKSTYIKFKEEGFVNGLEFDLVGTDGTTRRVSVNAVVVRDRDGRFLYTRSIMHDITDRVLAEARVVAESARFKAFLRMAVDGVCVLDSQGRVVEASDSFTTMLGYEREELMGARPTLWDKRSDLEDIVGQVLAGSLRQFETVHRRKDGQTFDVEVSAEAFEYNHGQFIFCASRNISERKRADRRIVHLATHDALTGLPNRNLFRDRLARSLSLALRNGTSGALLMIDLDSFKAINDRHGHEAGDKVLKVVASRLNGLVRDSDSVARIGGDEFAIVLDGITGEQMIKAFAGQLMQQVSLPLALDSGALVTIGASVGAAPFPAAGHSRRVLLAAADRAMYESKQAGHNVCTVSCQQANDDASGSQLFDAGQLPHTGFPAMDLAHELLAAIVASIEVAIEGGAGRIELLQKLGDLTAATSDHFDEEARWMEQVAYPDSEAHLLAHRQLLDELALLRSGLATGSDAWQLQALKDWLLIHIGAFDWPLAQHLCAHRDSVDLAELAG